jgi:hypothetical protein
MRYKGENSSAHFEREHLLAFPRDDAALLKAATLSSEDLAFIGYYRDRS